MVWLCMPQAAGASCTAQAPAFLKTWAQSQERAPRRVYFFWVVREKQALGWVREALEDVQAAVRGAHEAEVDISIYYTGERCRLLVVRLLGDTASCCSCPRAARGAVVRHWALAPWPAHDGHGGCLAQRCSMHAWLLQLCHARPSAPSAQPSAACPAWC